MKSEQHSYIISRYEFKYILDSIEAERLQNYMEKIGLESDDYSNKGPYVVNSLYFDTPFLDDYYDKDASLLTRKKVRARIYGDNWSNNHSLIWLEIKNKRNFHIIKERLGISADDWESFISTFNPFLITRDNLTQKDKEFIDKFSHLYIKGRYRPHIIVKYRRAAFLDSFISKIRITFDSNISACFANEDFREDFMTPVHFGSTIMEAKFNDKLPWWFTKAVENFDLKRSDFSKYSRSVAMLRNSYKIPLSR
ncbi:MAG: hypothetical protein A3G52_02345 [Candidatus Taylorbacteria bacterium RIFCSPLOWO2_12_FULL_43_20]|uniref:VTC domain-containing protein n=1 Tax=Candidatus Taylorbacteria bacterium RIFCSPLOWO2_12_FULL_43_20 TaxID=1802332 RepID=A0A1G2P3S9_9BACT|nr:MAG: hypothetical protein A3E92_02740 [Candidatus Taylorbacteria bacterium RIFCSPHIGHO2_12_FULL_42_34]OHA42933.1 MAG: hypothetical protein A3G52_02345 [Candidatus Taylorbacteria bacterium RIFCSPLOWO2_12_FULL_43_20]